MFRHGFVSFALVLALVLPVGVPGASGLLAFDPETEAAEPLTWPADKRIVNRFNDGTCDPQGRFWVGTIGRDQPTATQRRRALCSRS